MSIVYYSLDNFNDQNPYNQYFIDLKDNTYIFTVRYDDYDEISYLNISDYQDKPIVTGKALVNNLVIRNNKLPYVLCFVHLTGETYEPTIDNIASEFAIAYNDKNEVM